ncbi:sce7725 family protein [Fusobacterium polymorphum]|jgi:hypothetical protein|uniref:sce7725 family protein n=1 Tax=Fusobacterium nucleatum subsp. polymorphum TaxID=76857 RepID=UPI000BFCBC48|nr:sce7725 family protein [Fusobacterium polymorphum]PHI09066.1 hypothetical protein CA845_02875 [Fusobacterium polymorphum]
MYFPYLYSRGEEANAISTICQNGFSSNTVVPIIDVSQEGTSSEAARKMIMKLINNNQHFILLPNSDTMISEYYDKDFDREFYNYCILGSWNYFANDNRFNQEAILYNSISENFSDNNKIAYHIFLSEIFFIVNSFISQYGSNKVVPIFDAFKVWTPNANFPNQDIFLNYAFCYKYKNLNYAGFGDYTILSSLPPNNTSANAQTITHTIHLTKESFDDKNQKCIVVRHFLTTPSEEEDITTRSKKTISKVRQSQSEFLSTVGLKEILNVNGGTSLGRYKRVGIMHHIELMDYIIKNY